MASSGSGYDLSSSTFSPDGRIFQVEYASKAVDNGGSMIGIRVPGGGVILAVSKPILHKLVVPSTASYKRIHHVDAHVGMASTGNLPDARVVARRAMEEASDYLSFYNAPVPPKVLADRLAAYMHYFTLHGALRPFGAASLLAAYDADLEQAQLYLVEPNGVAYQYYAAAAGQQKQAAKTELEKLQLHKTTADNSRMTPTEAVQHVVKILMLLFREQSDHQGKQLELEVSWITKETHWQHEYVPDSVLKAAKVWADEQLEGDGDDDDAAAMEE
jgi:20S proteasome subunit alpha 7